MSAYSEVGRPRVISLTGGFCASRVLGTDMSTELLFALAFVVHLHLVDGFTDGQPVRLERPCASGATPALKILAFDPYEFATHRHLNLSRLVAVTALRKAA